MEALRVVSGRWKSSHSFTHLTNGFQGLLDMGMQAYTPWPQGAYLLVENIGLTRKMSTVSKIC